MSTCHKVGRYDIRVEMVYNSHIIMSVKCRCSRSPKKATYQCYKSWKPSWDTVCVSEIRYTEQGHTAFRPFVGSIGEFCAGDWERPLSCASWLSCTAGGSGPSALISSMKPSDKQERRSYM